MNNLTNKDLVSMYQNDNNLDISRYLKLLWGAKKWLLLIALLTSLVVGLLVPLLVQPEYKTTAIIRFDDPRSRDHVTPVADFAKNLTSESKLAILRTKSILGQVVDSLKLNLVIENSGIDRLDFFKQIKVTDEAKIGTYEFQKQKSGYQVLYSNRQAKIENRPIDIREKVDGSTVQFDFSGFSLGLDKTILDQVGDVTLHYIPARYAISDLNSNLEAELDRSKTILALRYSHVNPRMAAIITNTIASEFIEKLLDYKRQQTKEIMASLEDRLGSAEEELKKSETLLREYREKNPYVTLSSEGGQVVQDLVQSEKGLSDAKQKLNNLSILLDKKAEKTDFESKNLSYLELLSFLTEQNVVGAKILTDQFNSLINERQKLLPDHSVEHPYVKDVEQRIIDLRRQADDRVERLATELKREIRNSRSQVVKSRNSLQNLPAQEIRLAELERNRDINEQIVSSIMVRYNEAKVTDAAIVSDTYLIDEAQPPIVKASFVDHLQFYGLGFLGGLILGIAGFVTVSFFDPRVKATKDVEKSLKLPVLANIPVIGSDKPLPTEEDLTKKIDSKLITVDYAPTVEGEAFRMIRTKLVFDKSDAKKSYVITSLNPDEGKSLISSNLAITFAQQKYPTLLLDCDLRRGVLHNSFACNKKPGLSDLLKSNSELNIDSISKVIQETHIPNLFLISSGTSVPNPSELLGNLRMKQFHDIVQEKFGIVIIDTAPILFTPDAFVINSFVHNIVLVVRYGKTNLNKLVQKTAEFQNIRDDFAGVIVNASKDVAKGGYYSYSYYHY